MKQSFYLLLLIAYTGYIYAQNADSNKVIKRNKISGFPVAYYSPETKLALGVLGAYTFYNKNDSTQKYPSQVQMGAAYTFNNQLLIYFPFRVYSRQNNFTIYGEAGYYKYSYYFYGIGNNQPDDYKELYKVNFPRIRISVLKKLTPKLYAGIRYWLEDYKIKDTEPGKQLASGTIAGTNKNFIAGIGPAVSFDTRDNIFYPSHGYYIDASLQFYRSLLGSDFKYNRYNVDASIYFAGHGQSVYAFNVFCDFLDGSNIPFNQLALLGGNKKMRGYYEGRYRDKNLVTFAGEYRFHIYKRFGAVAFVNAGATNNQLVHVTDYILTSAGIGARYAINKAEKLNIRLDAAFGHRSSGYYFTIGEAF